MKFFFCTEYIHTIDSVVDTYSFYSFCFSVFYVEIVRISLSAKKKIKFCVRIECPLHERYFVGGINFTQNKNNSWHGDVSAAEARF